LESKDIKIMAQKQCRWLNRWFRQLDFVIDDEKYFSLTDPGNDSFFASSPKRTPDHVKYKGKSKYEPKIMLWIAISRKGISKPYFQRGGLGINQNVYQNECLRQRLFPFIREVHKDGKYIFWSDKASAHYANSTIDLMKREGIRYVNKLRNPTNVPQCRPIEDFFGYLSGKVYSNGWCAINLNQLKSRIIRCLKKVDLNIVQKSMGSVSKRLRSAADNGVLSVVH